MKYKQLGEEYLDKIAGDFDDIEKSIIRYFAQWLDERDGKELDKMAEYYEKQEFQHEWGSISSKTGYRGCKKCPETEYVSTKSPKPYDLGKEEVMKLFDKMIDDLKLWVNKP